MTTPCENSDVIKEMGQRLTKGEVLFAEIAKDLKSHTEILNRIEAQTTKTNGRVSSLEAKNVDALIAQARNGYTPMKLTRDLAVVISVLYTVLQLVGA